MIWHCLVTHAHIHEDSQKGCWKEGEWAKQALFSNSVFCFIDNVRATDNILGPHMRGRCMVGKKSKVFKTSEIPF